ncbi:MAG: hypothetical protein H6Q54_220, partial [Deltaproteobacteria bacterium]|nr:hypothetical protein [Deltaproteobacteria bacterium]
TPDSHVVHSPGHSPDVFRDLRLYENNGHMVEVNAGHPIRPIDARVSYP